jgi:hypothetical protein
VGRDPSERDTGAPYPRRRQPAVVRAPHKRGEAGRRRPPSGRAPQWQGTLTRYLAVLAAGRAALPTWWGTLTGGFGVGIVAGSAALGALVTVMAGSDPGVLLCLIIIIGTICAALAVKPRVVYKVIPAPVLAYLIAAMITGMIHDGAAGSSLTALALGAAQWIASGFIAMIIATLLTIAIALARLRGSRGTDNPGSSSGRGARPAAAGPGGSRRTPVPGSETARGRPAPESDTGRREPAPGADTVRLPLDPAAEPESARRPPSVRAWPGSAEPGTAADFPASAAFRDYRD